MRNINLKDKSLQNMLDNYEEEIVESILLKHKWNISKAAKELNIDRKRLYRIIRKNDLKQN